MLIKVDLKHVSGFALLSAFLREKSEYSQNKSLILTQL